MKCPFTKLPIYCDKKACKGCEIRMASETIANQEIAEDLKDYWKHLTGMAEK